MIRRLVILIRKELLQQLWVVLATAVLLVLVGLTAFAASLSDPDSPTAMSGVAGLLLFFVPLLGLILGHRVVVREYQAHAQLFLEALPLRRWEMLVAKYAFGLLAMALLVVPCVLAVAVMSSETSLRFLAIAALKTFFFILATWSLFFGFGLLGRLRFVAYVTLLLWTLVLQSTTSFEIGRFGPFALIDAATFSFERARWPVRALVECAVSAGAFIVLGACVALAYEGSLAEKLSRRASGREVIAVSVLLSAEIVAATWIGSKAELDPFEFQSATVSRHGGGRIQIMYGWPALESRAQLLGHALEALTNRLTSDFGLDATPAIRLAHNSLLQPGEVRDRSNSDRGGILLETNLGVASFELELVLEHSAHATFASLSRGRALFEPNHWFLDGFAVWCSSEHSAAARERSLLRGLAAARQLELGPAPLQRWAQTLEQLGDSASGALAFTVVDLLARRHGKPRLLQLARLTLAPPASSGIATWLSEPRGHFAERFSAITGEPWPRFLAAWRAELATLAAQAPAAGRLRDITSDRGQVRIERTRFGADVAYELRGPELAGARDCTLLHAKLPPYDRAVGAEMLKRHPLVWPANQSAVRGRVRGLYQPGDRVLLAVDCRYEPSSALMRLAAVRREVPP